MKENYMVCNCKQVSYADIANKKYYFKVRAYKKVGSSTVY